MEMYISKKIDRIVAKVKLANRPDNIRAFGEIQFYEEGQVTPLIIVRGFTIRDKQFGEKQTTTAVFPAYRTGKSFQTSFILEERALWSEVNDLLMNEYYQQVGDVAVIKGEDEIVDPSDVPF